MHRALRMPEILLIIFRLITDDEGKPLLPALATIARTCRLFQCQVEGILWYRILGISSLYNILPPRARQRDFQSWALSRRIFSGPDWTRFRGRASRIRVLVEDTGTQASGCQDEQCSAIFIALAALRFPVLLTPNLCKLEWRTSHASLSPAINLFIGPSLESLEIDAKLLINHVIRVPLGITCPRLKHLKITGNGRSAASSISSVLRGLHYLETLACSTLDNDAFAHLAQLKNLSYLAVDMRWSVLDLDGALCDRLQDGHRFINLQTLFWKDYDLDSLADMFLLPDVSPPNVYLEIESFCTSPSLCSFLHSFATRFPHTRAFSLVHDTAAGRRFGLQVGTPGREHQLDGASALKPLLALKSLRALSLVDLGHLQVNDDLVKTIASAMPELEHLRLGSSSAEMTIVATRPSAASSSVVTFDGLLSLLQSCPRLRTLGVCCCVDAGDVLTRRDTAVRHGGGVTHLRLELEGTLELRRAEVDEMLRRVLPGLVTVEESLDSGATWRVRDVLNAKGKKKKGRSDDAMSMPRAGATIRRSGGGAVVGYTKRQTRNSLESALTGG